MIIEKLESTRQQKDYVFDLTEPYPLKDQIKLYEKIKKERDDVLVYLSKQGILEGG